MTDATEFSLLTKQIAKAESDLIEIRTGNIEDQEDGMAILYTGQWHDAFPRQLVLNPILSPLEKVAWQAIRLSIHSPSKPGSTPRREQLATMINCSAATVTTARITLRACRWITFCKTVRKQGRFVGDIYLLHEQPLSLESTLGIDTTYIQFLQQQTQTSSKRLRGIAGNILKEIDGLTNLVIPNELDVLANRLQKTVISNETHHSKNFALDEHSTKNNKNSGSVDNALNRKVQNKMASVKNTSEQSQHFHQSEILSLAETRDFFQSTGAKNFFPSRAHDSSSSFINNKNNPIAQNCENESTKTTVDTSNPNPQGDPEKTFTLAIQHFPILASSAIKKYVILTFLGKEYQLPVVERMLSKAPEGKRDDLLLQYIGRRAAGYHGWTRASLHNPVAFVGELIRRERAGEFYPDEWALSLKNSIATKKEPDFWDSPDFRRMAQIYSETEP